MKWVDGPPTKDGWYWLDVAYAPIGLYRVYKSEDSQLPWVGRAGGSPGLPATADLVIRHYEANPKEFKVNLETKKNHIRIDSHSDIEDVYLESLLRGGISVYVSETITDGQSHKSLWLCHTADVEDLKKEYAQQNISGPC